MRNVIGRSEYGNERDWVRFNPRNNTQEYSGIYMNELL